MIAKIISKINELQQIECDRAYRTYNRLTDKPLNRSHFGRELKKHGISRIRKRINGKRIYFYVAGVVPIKPLEVPINVPIKPLEVPINVPIKPLEVPINVPIKQFNSFDEYLDYIEWLNPTYYKKLTIREDIW